MNSLTCSTLRTNQGKAQADLDLTIDITMDASSELARIRAIRAVQKKKRYRRSKLTQYKAELLTLKRNGATYTEMQFWLKEKKVNVAVSTITRWFKKQG